LKIWKPAEESNLVPFRPALLRCGLEDRCRERGPSISSKFQVRTCLKPETCNLKLKYWSGREADPSLSGTPQSQQSPFCRDESRPDKLDAEVRRTGDAEMNFSASPCLPFSVSVTLVPKEGLKPSTSGL